MKVNWLLASRNGIHVGHSGLSGEGAYPLLTTRIIIFWVVEALLQDHVGPSQGPRF